MKIGRITKWHRNCINESLQYNERESKKLTIDDIITKLSGINSLIDYKPIWTRLNECGVMGELVTAGMSILFIAMCIKLLTNTPDLFTKEGRIKGVLEINTSVFVKTLIFGFLILFYKEFCDVILGIFSAFSDKFFSQSLNQFKADFHYMMATIAGQSDTATPVFFPKLDATIEVFLFSVCLNFLIILFYTMLMFTPALLVLALTAGPILIPIGLYSRNVLKTWAMFLVGTGLFATFVGIGIMIINSMGFLQEMAETNLSGKMVQSIFLTTEIAVFLMAIPSTVAHLFGARPLATFSAVMGLLTFTTGMFSTSLSTISNLLLKEKRKKA